MRMPRLSIAQLMVLVGVVALNVTLVRAAPDYVEAGLVLCVFAPMALVLQASLLASIRSRGRPRLFCAGFFLFGTMAIVSLAREAFSPYLVGTGGPTPWEDYYEWAVRSLMRATDSTWILGSEAALKYDYDIAWWTRSIIVTTPQLAFALAGGVLCSLIARKKRTPPAENEGRAADATQAVDAPSAP
jgi:hypothetical protein